MKVGKVALLIVVFVSSGPAIAATSAEAQDSVWYLHWHNDALTSSDNMFTSGITLAKSSGLFSDLASMTGTPAFGKPVAKLFLPVDGSLHYREHWAVGQNIYTPDDLYIEELLLNDTPYAAIMGWSNAFSAFDDSRFTGFGFMLGWAGESALGEQSQNAAHTLMGRTDPKGWDNQLDFEPLLNAYFARKRKLWSLPRFDASVSFDAAAGNFLTQGQAALEMRIGHAPDGFASPPVPVGGGLGYDASLRTPGAKYLYATVGLRGTVLIHSLPLHGNMSRDNTWTDDNVIEPEDLRAELVLGLHREGYNWGLHMVLFFGTNAIEENEELFPSANATNSYGTITLEWRG